MITVHKFEIDVASPMTRLPVTAEVLKFGWQGGDPGKIVLWAKVDTTIEGRRVLDLHISGTGHPLPEDAELEYLDSVIAGPYVWHIWNRP